MISFEDFLMQEECDKYNMLQECNSYIKSKDREIKRLENQLQQKENTIKGVREKVEELAKLYDDNYTVSDKAKDILEILDKVSDE